MFIYILHIDRFYTFRLPKKVSGSYVLYDFDNYGYKRNLASIQANDGNWVICSNDSISVNVDGQNVDSTVLSEYRFYNLIVSNMENIVLYVEPGFNNDYSVKQISSEKTSIIVGSGSDADIVYANSSIGKRQIELLFSDGKLHYKNLNPKVPVYINGKVYVEHDLGSFDDIFLFGLKIIVCGDLLFINNPFSSVHFMSQRLIDSNCVYAANDNNDSRTYMDFYDASQYFSKSPVFRTKIKPLELEITSPEDKDRGDDSSIFMSIVPAALMCLTSVISTYSTIANYRAGKVEKETYVTTVIMCIVMLITSIVWPFVERFAEKIKLFIKEKRRIIVYRKYLKQKRNVLEKARNEQKMSLRFNNLSLKECQDAIDKRTANLFSVSIDQDSFLRVNLGTGRIPMNCSISYKKPDFIKFKDKLLDDIDKLIDDYRYIDDAPCSFCLKKNTAFINENGDFDKYLMALILQLVTFYDYENLKLVIFTSEKSKLSSIRNLNHCWDNERETRFFAVNLQEGENLSSQLIRIFNNRAGKVDSEKPQVPYFLIISDDLDTFRNLTIINRILDDKANRGFSVLFFADKISDVPSGCSYFVNYNDKEATLFQAQMEEMETVRFKPDFVDNSIDFDLCMKKIANTPIKLNSDVGGMLPEKLGFLELFNVGNVGQLNSVSRWHDAQVTNTLTAPIGVDSNGNVLSLDLHEKKHGPHGLIAGMTGSGKSEFIVTYILSLAVNYSPNEVQFVLIDYKGGGLAGAFENRKTGMKLPHLVGTITNLDKSSMNRTLVSIKSELQRRQRVFNAAKEKLNTGTIDIYKYQKLVREGALDEYMSHLFIICDEFAELKAQQPEFMDELVSAARIGRSLGVHLILATQKPSGVVDDQIWSNSKFKVCCKVQTAEDSKEMIRRDDAAYIKESGRFYLQVGYDEIFVKGQSAYTGVPYVPSETVNIGNEGKQAIEFIDNAGNIIKSVKQKKKTVQVTEDLGEELGNVLRYLIECADKIGFKNRQLWLDNVPTHLYYYDLLKKYPISTKRYIINPIIGEYDDPANQAQGPVSVNLTFGGNLWISGSFGGGKTTLLSTLIYSTIINHSTDEVNIYIIDCLAETLKLYFKAPQVGDFVGASDSDKLFKLFNFLSKEVEKRKKYFSTTGTTFKNDIQNGKNSFANILVFINGLDVLSEQYDELYSDLFQPLIRDCNRFGIIFIVTSTGSLSFSVENCFAQKIAMHYLDSTEYTSIFNNTGGIIPAGNPGRGLVELDKVYEFQTSLIFESENFDYNLSYVLDQLSKSLKKAPSIPVMPRIVTIPDIVDSPVSLDFVPVGIEQKSNCAASYSFDKLINFIFYSNVKMAISFIRALIEIMKKIPNVKIFVLNLLDDFPEIDDVKIYNSNFKAISLALYNNINKKKSNDPNAEKIIFFINDYVKIQNHLNKLKAEDASVITIDDLINLSIGTTNFKFILVNDSSLSSIDNKNWSDYYDSGNAIVLGMDSDELSIVESTGSYDGTKITKDTAILIRDYKRCFVKFVRYK